MTEVERRKSLNLTGGNGERGSLGTLRRDAVLYAITTKNMDFSHGILRAKQSMAFSKTLL